MDQQFCSLPETLVDKFCEASKLAGETIDKASKNFQKFFMAIDLAFSEIEQRKKYVLEHCPNKKVVHLTKYCKKERIRKKNFHRAMKIIEKIEKENW